MTRSTRLRSKEGYMNQQAKYKLIGFIMMFASSSLMGGIGAFTRFIDAPGDFVSFWRNFAGLDRPLPHLLLRRRKLEEDERKPVSPA